MQNKKVLEAQHDIKNLKRITETLSILFDYIISIYLFKFK